MAETIPLHLPDGTTISEPPASRAFSFRGDAAAANAVEAALGLSLPTSSCRAVESPGRAALWLGPDEWMIVTERDAANIDSALRAGLAPHAHSLVEVSDRDLVFDVSGLSAALLLNAGVPLDLHDGAFPPGMCVRTLLGKCGVLLWRRAPQTFRLCVARSFAPYAITFLAQAARGLPGKAVSPTAHA